MPALLPCCRCWQFWCGKRHPYAENEVLVINWWIDSNWRSLKLFEWAKQSTKALSFVFDLLIMSNIRTLRSKSTSLDEDDEDYGEFTAASSDPFSVSQWRVNLNVTLTYPRRVYRTRPRSSCCNNLIMPEDWRPPTTSLALLQSCATSTRTSLALLDLYAESESNI